MMGVIAVMLIRLYPLAVGRPATGVLCEYHDGFHTSEKGDWIFI